MIQLTELEFHKLLRYTEAVNALEYQLELLVKNGNEQIANARKLRGDYFQKLCDKYDGLSPDVVYDIVEDSFSLNPKA